MYTLPKDSPTLDRYLNGSKDFLTFLDQARSDRVRQLLRILLDRPGLNIDELAQAMSVRRTAAKHHVRRLERDHMVVRVRQGRHVLHFPSSTNQVQRTALALLRIPSIRAVAQALGNTPSSSGEGLASRLHVSSRTVRRAIRKLRSGGMIHFGPTHNGTAAQMHLHPELRIILARYSLASQPETFPAEVPPLATVGGPR